MSKTSDNALLEPVNSDGQAEKTVDAKRGQRAERAVAACFHCGERCPDGSFAKADKIFCCNGCLTVHDILTESGLGHFYDLSEKPGVRVRRDAKREHWAYLDEPALQQRLLDFTDGRQSRVTFHVPAIHCIACVWLLENLFCLNPGIGHSQVNYPKREVAIAFAPDKIKLSELVALLVAIGYEPTLTLGELEKRAANPARKRQWLQVGIAGFAFGNIMLMSLPVYLGLDSLSGPAVKIIFGWLSLALALPVVVFSAADYWKSALLSARRRMLTLDVPIALGLAALYAQSAFEIVSGRGDGFLDSLCGLIFFLLCGRAFQQKTHERLAFDRDYKSFFPLSVTRKMERQAPSRRVGVQALACRENKLKLELQQNLRAETVLGAPNEERVSISQLQVGDRIVIRNGELVPADAKLMSGPAFIDYSFVTGESEPVAKTEGEYLYAGGRQIGAAIEVVTVKPVSQGYLTSLWNHEAFQKNRDNNLNSLTNRYSRRFTFIVIGIALGAAIFWSFSGDAARGLKAFASVLIVACPCALALAAPFTLGTAQRFLSRVNVFIKNALVLERMAQVDAIVFDKTGTLTSAGVNAVKFSGVAVAPVSKPAVSPTSKSALFREQQAGLETRDTADLEVGATARQLTEAEERWIFSLTRHSTHPHSVRISESFGDRHFPEPVWSFLETPGCGIEGRVDDREVWLGSQAWMESRGLRVGQASSLSDEYSVQIRLKEGGRQDACPTSGSTVHLAIDGRYRGAFELSSSLRPEMERLVRSLNSRCEIALLSGDNERERARFRDFFGGDAKLHFNQSPLDKLGFIRRLQESGRTVMMVGDGLNDAGALKQSDVGVAVVEKVGAFSPASDVILEAAAVSRLHEILTLARRASRIVRVSFAISAAYNVAGVSIAAAGILSPLICAILMPVSSVSVVLFACGATAWAARRIIPKSEIRNPKEFRSSKSETVDSTAGILDSDFGPPSSFVIRHSSLPKP